MSAMTDVRTDDWTMWGIAGCALLTLVGLVMVMADTFGGNSSGPRDRIVKCKNSDCDFDASWSPQEVNDRARERFEQIRAENPEMAQQMLHQIAYQLMEAPIAPGSNAEEMMEQALLGSWGSPQFPPLAFTCPKCGQHAVYNAYQCPKCDKIFFPDMSPGGTGDKCPKCGYSKREEYLQERKSKKKKK